MLRSAAYVKEQEEALKYVRLSPDLSNEEKRRFFRSANTNLGTTALCLSGGASFGYCRSPVSQCIIAVFIIVFQIILA